MCTCVSLDLLFVGFLAFVVAIATPGEEPCCISHPSEKESSEKERKRVIDGNRGLKEKQSDSPFICNEDLCCVGVRKSSSIPAE